MIFVDSNKNYPRYLGDLQEAFPRWTFKQAIPSGWVQVREVVPPEISGTQMLVEEFPEEIDGKFYQKWSVIEMPEAAVSAEVPETAFERFSSDPKKI